MNPKIKSNPSWNELLECAKLAELYFKAQKDETQISTDEKTLKWIHKKFPTSITIIKYADVVIGYVAFLPANIKLMNDFLNDKINERRLGDDINQKIDLLNFNTLYLCAAFVVPKFRKKGLARKAALKNIKFFLKKSKSKLTLFCWPWSEEGENMAVSLAEELNLELAIKDH